MSQEEVDYNFLIIKLCHTLDNLGVVPNGGGMNGGPYGMAGFELYQKLRRYYREQRKL